MQENKKAYTFSDVLIVPNAYFTSNNILSPNLTLSLTKYFKIEDDKIVKETNNTTTY